VTGVYLVWRGRLISELELMERLPTSSRALHVELPRAPSSPARARRAIEEFLHGHCEPAVIETALMVGSELVTNAIRHTSEGCHLTLRLVTTEVVVEVRDNDVPVSADSHFDGELLGRGLGVVQSITRRWGVERHPDGGKIVWAEIPTGVATGVPGQP
jgi:hypothetical protein